MQPADAISKLSSDSPGAHLETTTKFELVAPGTPHSCGRSGFRSGLLPDKSAVPVVVSGCAHSPGGATRARIGIGCACLLVFLSISQPLAAASSSPVLTNSTQLLTNATAIEVHKDVTIKKLDEPPKRLPVGGVIAGEDEMVTGALGSNAEILFNDQITTWRSVSRTLFTFSAEKKKMNLEKGLGLISVRDGHEVFCETCALNMQVHSTAIVESFNVQGHSSRPYQCATKFILLEGSANVSTRDGKQSKILVPGQMIIQLEGEPLADVLEVDVGRLLRESKLITGFKRQLPSMAKMQAVAARQQRELWKGTLETTGLFIGGRGQPGYHLTPLPTELEGPYDPGVPDGFKGSAPPCPTCP